MKSFTVVFISNAWMNEDDPSDHKEWKDVTAIDANSAMKPFEGNSVVVKCTPNE